jgi:hypothetical protein
MSHEPIWPGDPGISNGGAVHEHHFVIDIDIADLCTAATAAATFSGVDEGSDVLYDQQ